MSKLTGDCSREAAVCALLKNAAYVFRCLCQPLRIAAWCSAVSHTAPRWLALLEPCREVSQRAAALLEHPRSRAPRTVTLKHLLEFWETFIVLFVGDSGTVLYSVSI